MENPSQVTEKDSIYEDEDGICEDSEAGCELTRITISSEPPEESISAGKTSNSCPGWLVDAWRHYKKKPEFHIMTADWVRKYPDLVQLIKESKDRGEIDAIPSNAELDRPDRVPCFYLIIVKPDMSRILENEPLRVHRQVIIDGRHVDVRNKRGLMMTTSPIENLLALAQVSLEELAREADPKVRRAHVMYLRDLIGFRGHELPEQRKAAILEVLSSCTQEARVGNT